jgi:glutamyl-tRNA reductase
MSTGKLRVSDDEEDMEEVVNTIRDKASEARREEVEYALRRLNFTDEQERVVEQMAENILDRLLEPPVNRLYRAAEEGDDGTVETAKQLFDIPE